MSLKNSYVQSINSVELFQYILNIANSKIVAVSVSSILKNKTLNHAQIDNHNDLAHFLNIYRKTQRQDFLKIFLKRQYLCDML